MTPSEGAAPQRSRLPWTAVLVLLALSAVWGGNMVAIKIGVREAPPFYTAGLRSLVAGLCVAGVILWRRMPLFPSRAAWFHGFVAGTFFGLEFACIYLGLKITLATRTSILLYTHPFFVAVGAHFFLAGDRLNLRKVFGLLLAFSGIVLLYAKDWGPASMETLPGDLLILAGAFGWAATTVYIKRFLAEIAHPLQTLFYQLAFSFPVLMAGALLLEAPPVLPPSGPVLASFLYQCFIVAFLSYVAWFELIHRYPVTLLAAFTFFTPLCGVFLSWLLLPDEPLRSSLLLALALVCAGMVLVNRPPRLFSRS